jgi:hypothetical protein
MTMIVDQTVQAYLRSLPVDEVTAWKQRLEHHRSDCGCRVDAIVMLTVTAIWTVYSFLAPELGRSWQRTTIIGLAVLSVSGLIGKLTGLLLARVRFHLTIRGLRRRVRAGGTAQLPQGHCG